MAWPSHSQLRAAQQFLRRDDKAIRLRFSMEHANTILLERKTFVGRYGALLANHDLYLPDSGYRRENGHVSVCSIPAGQFDVRDLRDSLQMSDTWKWSTSLADRTEQRERQEQLQVRRNRQDFIRYKASNLFDNYVWKYKQRVNVPTQIR